MSDRWEYMTICWVAQTSPSRQDLHIWRPGEEEEIRRQWSKADPDAPGPKPRELLNEFGADGWELVSDTVTESAVGRTISGWDRGGFPVRREWTLKRRIDREAP
jgi:hypothetical protein